MHLFGNRYKKETNQHIRSSQSHGISERLSSKVTSKLLLGAPASEKFKRVLGDYLFASIELRNSGWTPAEVEKALALYEQSLEVELELDRRLHTSGTAMPNVISIQIHEKLMAAGARMDRKAPAGSISESDRPAVLKQAMDAKKPELLGVLASVANETIAGIIKDLKVANFLAKIGNWVLFRPESYAHALEELISLFTSALPQPLGEKLKK